MSIDPRKRLVATIIVDLIHKGWRPPSRLPEQGFDRLVDKIATTRSTLTPKELRTLTLLAHGMTFEEAARAAGVSRETVKAQAKNAAVKLGARNTTHAVGLAMHAGLVELADSVRA